MPDPLPPCPSCGRPTDPQWLHVHQATYCPGRAQGFAARIPDEQLTRILTEPENTDGN